MILHHIETITKEERIASCAPNQVVSKRFYAVIELELGITVDVEIPENILAVLKDAVFSKASDLVIRQSKYLQFEPEPGKRKEDYKP